MVEIGLEETEYTVPENGGPQEVCARVLRGELERSVEVDISTLAQSAAGR